MLAEVGATGKPEILLLNKTDTEAGADQAEFWNTVHAGSIAISAKTGAGLGQLTQAVLKAVRGTQVDTQLSCSVTDGKLIAFVRSHCLIHEERIDGDTMTFDVTVGRSLLRQLQQNPAVRLTGGETVAADPARAVESRARRR